MQLKKNSQYFEVFWLVEQSLTQPFFQPKTIELLWTAEQWQEEMVSQVNGMVGVETEFESLGHKQYIIKYQSEDSSKDDLQSITWKKCK